jgi:hypothetical protein
MWGNLSDLSAAKGGREFVVETMPAIIAPVSVPRARALAGFAVLEPTFEAVVQEQHRTLVLTNPRTSKLHGEVRLQAPSGWRLEPAKVMVDVGPLSQAKIDVAFHIPGNQAAGDYALQARLMIEGDELNGLNLRAPLYVRTPGLDVSVMSSRSGAGLTIFQRITNRTQESLNLQGAVLTAGRPRQTRMISELAPGQTTVREYQLDNAAGLAGKPIRVSLEQINGPMRHNTLLRLE